MEVDSAMMTSLDAPCNIGHTTELACSDVLDIVLDIVKMSAVLQPGPAIEMWSIMVSRGLAFCLD